MNKEKQMKSAANQTVNKRAFTIVELLTVMSIIVILIGLLVPALNNVRRYALKVKQMAQLHSMDAAIQQFSAEFEGYPPSNALDENNQAYCGAMKLCEAMMGQDLLGFHSNSVFRRDGLDATGTIALYPPLPTSDNLKARGGRFLDPESANALRIEEIYGSNTSPFLSTSFVICDVHKRQMKSGNKTGMPILYYKANTANSLHDPNYLPTPSDNKGNIYNYWDNQALLGLGKPSETGGVTSKHNLATPERFYQNTRSDQITTISQPYRSDSYILISAGYDGEYGTADDICNFEWRYKE
jgi:type II secretory pathway pseudopilin PulG